MSRIELGVYSGLACLAIAVAAIFVWPESAESDGGALQSGVLSAAAGAKNRAGPAELAAESAESAGSADVGSGDAAPRSAAESIDPAQRASVLASLANTVQYDPLATNRIAAIEGMRQLAASTGDADESIRSYLRAVTDDHDPDVTRHAREAYQEIDTAAGSPP